MPYRECGASATALVETPPKPSRGGDGQGPLAATSALFAAAVADGLRRS